MTTTRGRLAAGLLLSLSLLATGCGSTDVARDEVALDGVFAAAGEATSYTIFSFTAQELSSSLLGVDTETEIDEDRPAMVAEVTPDLSHFTADLTDVIAPGGNGPEVGFEMWVTPDRITLDSREYAVLKETNPAAELGPFEPGISYLDLDAVGEERPEVAELILGQGVTDLATMSADVLADVEREGSTITGTASYADIMGAFGTDIEQLARGLAGGLALNLGIDVDELTGVYVDFYSETVTDVTIELDDEDRLSSLEYNADLSDLYTRIFDTPALFDPQPSEAELAEAQELAADTVWEVTTLQRFDIDPDLEIAPVPATDDDRTDEWLTFIDNSGV